MYSLTVHRGSKNFRTPQMIEEMAKKNFSNLIAREIFPRTSKFQKQKCDFLTKFQSKQPQPPQVQLKEFVEILGDRNKLSLRLLKVT